VKEPVTYRQDKTFLYRIDNKGLKAIQAEGFRCGPPSRITKCSLKSETELAREKGLRNPSSELEGEPRGYFFTNYNQASHYGKLHNWQVTKYPNNYEHIYPDGYFDEGAVYVIFPGHRVGDIVIPPTSIEIFINEKWKPLKKVNLDRIATPDSTMWGRLSRLWEVCIRRLWQTVGYKKV
jgi:hypothetical protein